MMPPDASKSTGEMLADIMGNVSNLVRNEVDLARAEIGISLNKAMAAAGAMAIALVLAIVGLNVLAAALVTLAIRAGLSPTSATLVVGLGLLIIACLVFLSARSAFSRIGFVPTRAARAVGRDTAAIKEAYNDK